MCGVFVSKTKKGGKFTDVNIQNTDHLYSVVISCFEHTTLTLARLKLYNIHNTRMNSNIVISYYAVIKTLC